MTITTTEAAQVGAARLAGAMYLITMATAVFGEFFVRGSLIVSGDATQTAQNIIGSERLFRIGVGTDLATFTGLIVLTWALYVLLRPVDRNLALLAASFRLVEVAIYAVATLFSFVALVLLGGAEYLKAFDASQLHSLARVALRVQGHGLNLSFILAGLGSSVFAYLLLRSGFVPKALAAWGVFSSLLLATYGTVVIVFPAVRAYWIAAMFPVFTYEVTLGLWLLLKRVDFRTMSARMT